MPGSQSEKHMAGLPLGGAPARGPAYQPNRAPLAAPTGPGTSSHTSGSALAAPRRKFIQRIFFWRRPQPSATSAPLEKVEASAPVSDKNTRPTPPLMIINAQTLTLKERLKRDPKGLYTNKQEMNGFKNVVVVLLAVITIILVAVIVVLTIIHAADGDVNRDDNSFDSIGLLLGILVPLYVAIGLYHLLELLVGTMYLQREGWIFLESALWFDGAQKVLGHQDNNFKKLES
ncbi:hypothetical protein C8R45DRAFT_412006 [Mycena sanguinolenta]|nr:hypothetical protein C8R45DRAFT_412006 [Mycena sanguinolenta]